MSKLKKYVNGNFPLADDLNYQWEVAHRQNGYNTVRQLVDRNIDLGYKEYGEAYTSAGGRKGSVVTGETTATFDTNKYKTYSTTETVYVIIEATSVTGSFAINNCVLTKIATNRWILTCTTGTDEVKRAQIYKTLFYGTNGSDARASATYMTGVTSLRTSVTKDIGKTAYYVSGSITYNTGSAAPDGRYTWTFGGASGNNVSSWSRVATETTGNFNIEWRIPDANVRNSKTGTDSGATDHFGVDRETDENNNPSNFSVRVWSTQNPMTVNRTANFRVLILSESDFGSPSVSGTSFSSASNDKVTYYELQEIIENLADNIITHKIPLGQFPVGASSMRVTPFILLSEWEDGADVEWKLKTFTGPYVIIEATSISSFSDFSINDCNIQKIDTQKWVLFCHAGNDAVKRAQIYKTLFYGTNGANPRASPIYITEITALKTSVTRDVGKRAFTIHLRSISGSSGATANIEGTFANTTTNLNVSTWSNFTSSKSNTEANWQIPVGTKINSVVGVVGQNSIHVGTDRESDELNNPSNLRLLATGRATGEDTLPRHIAVILSVGDITFTDTTTSGTWIFTKTKFFDDNSIPEFTSAETIHPQETDWISVGRTGDVVEFTPFTIEPTQCQIKLVPKDTNPTAGLPAIRGVHLSS